jgi:beta-glucanase (GH16 family)
MPQPRMPRRSIFRAAAALGAGAAASAIATPAWANVGRPRPALVDRATPQSVRPLVGGTAQALVFSDEFTGTSLNTAKWNAVEQHRASGNHGVDYWYKSANVRLTNGALALDISQLGTDSYGGSRVDSQGKYDLTFGTIEFSVHVPPTIGHLAAAWLQASNGLTPGGAVDGTARDGAEIDVTETFSTGDQFGVTIHWDGYGADHQSSNTVANAPGLHNGAWYHTFTLNWSSTRMTVSYDGTVVRTITDPKLISQVGEFPIVSNEIIGYAQGDIHNAPLDWHSTMYVDYIRVWQ